MQKTYDEFIQNILDTRGRFNCGDEYHERHHIIPKCMNGTNDNDNLIDLYAKEHFIAHKLLAEENPENKSLTYAWHCMAFMSRKDTERYELTPEEYEEVRIAFRMSISGENSHRFGKPSPNKGCHLSQETKDKIRAANKGKIVEQKTRIKQSQSQKERFKDIEERKKYKEMFSGENAPMYGKHHSEETKKKISESKKGNRNPNYGKCYSEEERKRLSELLSGKNHPNYGKHPSEETRSKISKANTNPSSETRMKMRNAKIGKYDGVNNPRAKAVVCLTTNVIYGAASVASQQTGVNAANIRQCCNGYKKSAGGCKWKFVYDTTQKNEVVVPGALTLGLITADEVLRSIDKKEAVV